MSHVTGGGLAANLERVLPDTVSVRIDRSTWTPAPVFDLVRRTGSVEQADLEMTLNCGVGMVSLVPAADVDRSVEILGKYGIGAWVAGEVTGTPGGRVTLESQHPGW